MSIDTILTRLQLNHAEISGIVRSFKLPPSMPIQASELPAVYAQPGGMTAVAPRTSAGQAVISRRYRAAVCVAEFHRASTDSGNDGDPAFGAVHPFIDLFINYWLAHPRLNTSLLGDLEWIVQDISFQDSGAVRIIGPGGGEYAGFTMDYTIEELRRLSPGRIS
jgi:hypothetical protein